MKVPRWRLALASAVVLAVGGQLLLDRYLLWGLLPAFVAVALAARTDEPDSPVLAGRDLALVLVVAAGLHLWHLTSYPPGLFFDEAQNGLESFALAQSPHWVAWSHELSGRPTLFLYVLAAAQAVLGPHALVLRSVVAAANVLTMLAMAWALAPLLGRERATLAAAIYGVTAYHLLYSRIIYEASISTLPLVVAVGCAIRALEERGYRWWLAWGAALGVGLWTYAAFRLVPVVFVIALGVVALRRPPARRRVLVGSAVGLGLAAVIALPLLITMIRDQDAFFQRARETSLMTDIHNAGSLAPLERNLRAYGLLFFANAQDSNQIYDSPALGTVAAAAAWLGLGSLFVLARRGRGGTAAVLALWWTAGLLPGILTVSVEAPHWSRTLYALPAAAAIAAIGLERAAAALAPRRRRIAVLGLLAVLAAGELAAFRTGFEDRFESWYFFTPAASCAGRIARERTAEGVDVLAGDSFAGEPFDNEVFRYSAGVPTGGVPALAVWDRVPLGLRERPVSVLFGPREADLARSLVDLESTATIEARRDPWGEILFWEARFPAGQTVATGATAGLLVRASGVHVFHLPQGETVQVQGEDVRDGDALHLDPGVWRLSCPARCSDLAARVDGVEAFALGDRLIDDRFAGHGLLAVSEDANGRRCQLDRLPFVTARGIARARFTVDWTADLAISDPGEYTFLIGSDDDSRLEIDDEVVVDNSGEHPYIELSGVIALDAGTHRLHLAYRQREGDLRVALRWQPPGSDQLEPIPLEALTPPPGSVRRVDPTVPGR